MRQTMNAVAVLKTAAVALNCLSFVPYILIIVPLMQRRGIETPAGSMVGIRVLRLEA